MSDYFVWLGGGHVYLVIPSRHIVFNVARNFATVALLKQKY